MRSLLCLVAMAPPVFACPAPPPAVEVVANATATIAPGGGVIVRVERAMQRDGRQLLTIQADGAKAALEPDAITANLYVLRPKAGIRKLEVVRGGKVVNTLRIAATPPLSAPKVARVSSTASRAAESKFYAPESQFSLVLGGDAPADAYALVVYKVDQEGARAVAHGKPSKRVFAYATGGKNCGGGNFEPIFAGEQISVAWLDVHGALSPRSPVMTVKVR